VFGILQEIESWKRQLAGKKVGKLFFMQKQ